MGLYKITPCTISAARRFVAEHHRHHKPPVSGLFALGLTDNQDELIGVAIVGRPVARALQDGATAEVTRVCILDGHANACSMILSAAWRAARALGYTRLITYTLESEAGASLRGAGWTEAAKVKGRQWSCPSRPRGENSIKEDKRRWEVSVDRLSPRDG